MINTTELRKGNYVNFHNEDLLSIVKGIDADDLGITVYIPENDEENWIECDQFLPIPLTEEWLLKFGFENDSYSNFTIKLRTANNYPFLMVSFKDYACASLCENVRIVDYDIKAPCKYVHQLQNIFYALTGEELTIK